MPPETTEAPEAPAAAARTTDLSAARAEISLLFDARSAVTSRSESASTVDSRSVARLDFDTASLYGSDYGTFSPHSSDRTLGSNPELVGRGDSLRTGQVADGPYDRSAGELTMVRQTDAATGSVTDLHTGRRPSDNFILTTQKDGQLTLKDSVGEIRGFPTSPAIDEPRKALLELAGRTLTNPNDLSRFQANMLRLERRAGQEGLSENAVADTYRSVMRLMSTDVPNATLPLEHRLAVAQQIMAQAAQPQTIDQGSLTCSVAAGVESRLYSRNPETAARVLADIGLTGKFSLPQKPGTEISMPHMENLAASFDPRTQHPPKDKDRSFASTLMQVAAINAVYQDRGKGDEVYYGFMPRGKEGALVEGLYKKDGSFASADPNFSISETLHASSLFESPRAGSFLMSGDRATRSYEGRTVPEIADRERIAPINSTEDLRKALENARTFPLTANIVTPLPGSSWSGADSLTHVLNISGYDRASQTVQIDDQQGSSLDVKVTLGQLLHSINPQAAERESRDRLAELQRTGRFDFATGLKELVASENATTPAARSAWLGATFDAAMTLPTAERAAAIQSLHQLSQEKLAHDPLQRETLMKILPTGLLPPENQREAMERLVAIGRGATSVNHSPGEQLEALSAVFAAGVDSNPSLKASLTERWAKLAVDSRLDFSNLLKRRSALSDPAVLKAYDLFQKLPINLQEAISQRISKT